MKMKTCNNTLLTKVLSKLINIKSNNNNITILDTLKFSLMTFTMI